jgi:hypothetical protein
MQKRHLIDSGGDDSTAGMAHSSDGRAQIDEMHDTPTEHVAEEIGVIGQANFRVFGLGLANSSQFSWQGGIHK